jgi:HD-GYP domain-containing protein (c-di-GMP phosphodiesterase class II)
MTQETRRDLRFSVFCTAVVLGSVALVAYAWSVNTVLLSESTWPAFAVILGALCVSEYLAVVLPAGPALSLSYPLSVAAIVLFGPFWGASVTAVSALPWLFERERPSLLRFGVNTAQRVIAVSVGGLLFVWLGGVPLVLSDISRLGSMLIPLAAVATAGILVNAALLAMTLSLMRGETFVRIWNEVFVWTLPSQIVLGFAGVAIAAIVDAVEVWGFALFVMPLLVARQTYQQSVKLRAAYADTISSLVAALEAKDMYTKGHSVRVAEYTVLIAEALDFPQDRLQRIEQAALLHDLGKVGVSRRVLAKEAKLTDGEYDEIKRHPDIGAHIVADVPYLADLVPMIEHHHTWFDGRGYGGASGDMIPVEARILTVADSYDAMTSARPYRGAMSHEDALQELRRNSGTQFDPDAVEAFELGWNRAREAELDRAAGEVGPDED